MAATSGNSEPCSAISHMQLSLRSHLVARGHDIGAYTFNVSVDEKNIA
ncbi:MAG: hypothetical protein HKN63_03270 [Rhodobacteraceae bacterium]|nr:hypothetical protein [Paracoccaceae bacterium]